MNFNSASITNVGSFIFSGLNGVYMESLTLFGATFKAIDPDAFNKLIVKDIVLKASGYKRSAPILEIARDAITGIMDCVLALFLPWTVVFILLHLQYCTMTLILWIIHQFSN